MSQITRKQRNKFECGHRAFGKYCHFCKDVAAGRVKPVKKIVKEDGSTESVAANAVPMKPKTWKKAKCPYCGGSRVKKLEINVLSDLDAKEYKCGGFDCGKEFNSEQVKEYEEVEVKERKVVGGDPRRLTD